ncbi:UDP-N-acetylglucosamine 1-carboxyvinyltransferase [Biscogniauxia sp. FL1348]|nr:UDP-N-acetylglucosamine 1-carboxyvinyltransferase [Biscogniauxia sp. FL1348]
MDRLTIRGGHRLEGRVPISGSKNAALTLMPCALLTDEPLTLSNVPRLADVDSLGHLLNGLGVSTTTTVAEHTIELAARSVPSAATVPCHVAQRTRASILVLGPLVARAGRATVPLPGGCAIGRRPVDLHLRALEALGVQVELTGGRYVCARGRLVAGRITMSPGVVSVGATATAVMAAVLARGRSVIENAAREPEIVDLCRCLIAMGAVIGGVGTGRLTIEGRDRLHGAAYRVMPDRIEAGSYACAAAITGGDLLLVGAVPGDMGAILLGITEAGATVTVEGDGVRVAMAAPLRPLTLSTAPYPAFPTDMQPQFMAMLALTEGGTSQLTETLFENRYMHVPELRRMGAGIQVHGRVAVVKGVARLTGAPVMATDLRASMSLVLVGLAAVGETQVLRAHHLDRGYERLEEKLSAVGADIKHERVGPPDLVRQPPIPLRKFRVHDRREQHLRRSADRAGVGKQEAGIRHHAEEPTQVAL